MTEVTQEDIEAVNAFHSVSFRLLMDSPKNNLNAQHQALLEAFARHREAAALRGKLAMLEQIGYTWEMLGDADRHFIDPTQASS